MTDYLERHQLLRMIGCGTSLQDPVKELTEPQHGEPNLKKENYMYKMNENRMAKAMDLTTDLLAKARLDHDDALGAALLAYRMLADMGYGEMTTGELKECVGLCGRILDQMPLALYRGGTTFDGCGIEPYQPQGGGVCLP